MKRFTKSLIALALLFAGTMGANAEKKYADLSKLANGPVSTWDSETNTITWQGLSNNMVSNFDFEAGDYSSWEKIVVNITSLNNADGIRVQVHFQDGSEPAKDFKGTGAISVNLSEYGTSEKLATVQWIRMLGSGYSSGESHTISAETPGSAVINEVYLERPDDPLALPKDELKAAINVGKAQNAFGKTTESFGVLTTAIASAENELKDAATTKEKLEAAKKAIENAITGFVLEDGYTNLTVDMFMTWDDNYKPVTSTPAGCLYALNESTGQLYGDGSVQYLNFADISDFSALYVVGTEGSPRIMMNRREVGVSYGGFDGDSNGGGYDQIVQGYTEGQVVLNLTTYDYAHLNAIKSAGWGQVVTASDMLLYRTLTVGDVKWATFGSLSKNAKLNGVTAYAAKYADGKLTLTEVTNVPAGKGVVVEATAAGSYAPTFDVEASDIESDLLVSNGTVAGNGNIYVLAKGTKGVGFYKLASGEKVPAGKAYLETTAGGREFIGFADDATAIKSVETVKADGAVYNLAGQQVKKAQKGVYIINGKKAVVK